MSSRTPKKLDIRNELSLIQVLRLRGIVGCSLGSSLGSEYLEKDLNDVIEKVHRALVYAQSKGVYHMDVRPSNIFVKKKAGEGLDVLPAD